MTLQCYVQGCVFFFVFGIDVVVSVYQQRYQFYVGLLYGQVQCRLEFTVSNIYIIAVLGVGVGIGLVQGRLVGFDFLFQGWFGFCMCIFRMRIWVIFRWLLRVVRCNVVKLFFFLVFISCRVRVRIFLTVLLGQGDVFGVMGIFGVVQQGGRSLVIGYVFILNLQRVVFERRMVQ